LGHEVLILGWWWDAAAAEVGLDAKPCPVSPVAAASTITNHVDTFKPQFLVTLGDVPWLGYLVSENFREVLLRNQTRWCLYFPVDGTLPDGRLPPEWVRILSQIDFPVTMSHFGLAASARSGINATYVPHGCDTELFRPPNDKEGAKRRFGYEGKFVILSDVRNHRRKLIPRILDIITRLKIPRENLVLHLHTCADTQEDAESYRYNVRVDIELLKLDVVKGVREGTTGEHLTMRELADLYAAADVHLLASFGEGFGLPTLQAASAGAVPLVAANSANVELVRNHGFAVPCDSWTTDEFGLARGFIDRAQAASILELLYENPELLQGRSEASRRFALDFSWDSVGAAWDALFHEPGFRRCNFASGCAERREASPAEQGEAPSAARPSAQRPTGHDSSALPIPRIGVPTRLEIARNDHLASSAPLILAEASCVARLGILRRLFPGTQILPLHAGAATGEELAKLIEAATLAVDPDGRIAGLDRACADGGTNYLGRSQLWSAVSGRSLISRVRLLLTDYPLSEARAAAARDRACTCRSL
jgi:glycosyltransferase involved in cell wall biosynthesis